MDAIDGCVVGCNGGPEASRKGMKLLDFIPFNPVDKRTAATYVELATGNIRRATKGMTGIIIESKFLDCFCMFVVSLLIVVSLLSLLPKQDLRDGGSA